ncbi:YciI family protein [uncultured Tateyamaria sp.]|uniref:YciI family protein n=1 Tax=uncultured Tateyamaria sp. TaxID=455651 RepID=UPI00263706BC|nr:YciI family protein [uncultured Tateyamaria sp.]
MPYLILFEDAQDHDHVRAQYMPDHLAFLTAHADAIQSAGPLFDGDIAAGGAWIVNVGSMDKARALVEADPFWPTGLRKSVRILRWNHVFADGVAMPPKAT